jgi:GxxExxY protein
MHINELSSRIIGAAIEVHRILGPGLLESAYETSLCYELKQRKLSFERQKRLPVIYKGEQLDCGYVLDVVVERQIILELKLCEQIKPIHKAQLLTYLKLSALPLGLLLNFNRSSMREGIVRVLTNYRNKATMYHASGLQIGRPFFLFCPLSRKGKECSPLSALSAPLR